MDKQLNESYKDYDDALEDEDFTIILGKSTGADSQRNICREERYRLADTDLDIYIWDTLSSETVAAATFEQEYWIRTDDGFKYFDTIQKWESTVEEYLGIRLSDLNVISESEIKSDIKS